METLSEIIRFQSTCIKISNYENELRTIAAVRDHPKVVSDLLRLQMLEWINSLSQTPKTISDKATESTQLRNLGNDLFRKAPKENALAACLQYTKAIMAAPLGEALALAHANRAIALQKFGYYMQAYDDCECAFQQGYPSKMRHKLWARQAFCAYHLRDAELLKKHLNALSGQKVNSEYAEQVKQLTQGLKELGSSDAKKYVGKYEKRKNTHILNNKSKGRYMVASESIAENDIIFTERATAFVPIGNRHLCQECASTLFIPFPCYHCEGKVVYCSLQCKRAHHKIHVYECAAYERSLFAHVGIAHLALRLVLVNMPKLTVNLVNASSVELIWQQLSQNFTNITQDTSSTYEHTLHLETHLDKMSLPDILWFAIVSDMLVLYLSEFTEFFLLFSKCVMTVNDWKLLTGALILRHIGQLIVNGHSCIMICHNSISQHLESMEFPLMSNNIWASPLHLRRGYLHQFSDFADVAAANFPYLSMCNHSCSPSFQIKYSGRCISIFAAGQVQTGEEIFNCYTLDHRKSKKTVRWNTLKDTYHFSCECSQCKKKNPDDYYEKFHRYRCDQPKCQKIYTLELLDWWEMTETRFVVKCSVCKARQSLPERHVEFMALLKRVKSRDARRKLYKYFQCVGDLLVEYNHLKLIYANQIITECFGAHIAGSNLCDDEFSTLIHILKFYLCGIGKQSSTKSIEYVAKMTYLWDFVALGKYKPSDEEMTEMTTMLYDEFVADEMQELLKNYFHDYIAT